MERRLAAVLAADVVGYSRLMGADEAGTLERLKSLRKELVQPKVTEHGGRIVKLMGDGLLAEFSSVVNAVQCALDIQKEMTRHEPDRPDVQRIRLRIGVNLGDIIFEGSDIYGDGVNVAARMESLAEPGGICLSGDTYRQIRGKVEAEFQDLGEQNLKNVAEPVQVYHIAGDSSGITDLESAREPLALPDKPSIAVLPFTNMSGDLEQEYFSDGITEDIITDLSKLSKLFVIARTSSFTYKGKTVKMPQIAKELGVRYVLEGSVRKAGERVRITAQLIDAAKGHHLWAERYDREIGDIFTLQDELSRKIVASTAVKLSEGDRQRLTERGTNNVEAYDYLLRGREQLLHHTREANSRAQELLKKAAKLDPSYARAYGHLAEAHLQRWQLGWSPSSSESLECALECAERAVILDDNLGLGHGVLGQIYLWQMRHEEAVAEGERRLALDPSDTDGIATLAMTLVFSGLPKQALEMIEPAIRLDPHYPFWHLYVIGLANLALGLYDDAIAAFKRGIVRNPDSTPFHKLLAACYALSGEMELARAEVAETLRLNPGISISFVSTQLPYRQPDDLARLVDGLRKAGLPE